MFIRVTTVMIQSVSDLPMLVSILKIHEKLFMYSTVRTKEKGINSWSNSARNKYKLKKEEDIYKNGKKDMIYVKGQSFTNFLRNGKP